MICRGSPTFFQKALEMPEHRRKDILTLTETML